MLLTRTRKLFKFFRLRYELEFEVEAEPREVLAHVQQFIGKRSNILRRYLYSGAVTGDRFELRQHRSMWDRRGPPRFTISGQCSSIAPGRSRLVLESDGAPQLFLTLLIISAVGMLAALSEGYVVAVLLALFGLLVWPITALRFAWTIPSLANQLLYSLQSAE